MKIVNYRHRFANNSSSSHSVCFRKGAIIPSASPVSYPLNPEDDYDYLCDLSGWQESEASDPTTKAAYIAMAIYTSIEGFLGKSAQVLDAATTIAQTLTGVPRDSIQSLDHQSTFVIPMGYPEYEYSGPRHTLPTELLESIKTVYINNDDVVIYSGNDNDGWEASDRLADANHTVTSFQSIFTQAGRYISRREVTSNPNSHIYTMYCIDSGDRATIDLTPWISNTLGNKLYSPLLVDMKLTDFCEYGCAFCYQGSTKEGKHADLYLVDEILKDLHHMKVFEIAFGGGEPTKHPYFSDILKECRNYGIQPNFTTFNLKFLENSTLKAIVKNIGASFAVSNPTEMTLRKIKYLRSEGYRVSAQYVDGLRDLTKALTYCGQHGIPVTVLGYKVSGRGGDYLPNAQKMVSHEEFMQRTGNILRSNAIAYDTVFLRQHSEALPFLDVRSFDTREGYQSWYIDAVARQHGPSSYETGNMLPLHYTEKKDGYRTGYFSHATTLADDWKQCVVTE